jgi:hypothetical protein
MSKLSLNTRVKALVLSIGKTTQSIQDIGVECLVHAMGDSHDVTPLNTLYLGLSKGHHILFANWALAHAGIQVNPTKTERATIPFKLAKGGTWDIKGATDTTWNEAAPKADKALAETFDMQAAFRSLLKKASGVCTPEQLADLQKIAVIAHVDASKVVAKVATATALPPVPALVPSLG